MSMLAEQRRKQKYSHNPRGNLWSNDDSKFGQKLMEKMGWSKGKGLGANLDGQVDHVSVAVKNDSRGVGCSKNHADNWIAHQDDFNDLLSSLNKDHSVDSMDNQETASKVTSLEEKSKTSRSRVHYQKFTKGKDLSLKSATDLDCVFGKRKAKSGDNTPQTQSEVNSDASDEENKALHGVVTVKSSDSIQEYFAKKMQDLKRNQAVNQSPNGRVVNPHQNSNENGSTPNEDSDSKLEITKSKKKKRKHKEEKVSFVVGGDSSDNETKPDKKKVKFDGNETVHCYDEIPDSKSKKKKKSKKNSKDVREDFSNLQTEVMDNCELRESTEMVEIKSKKRKSKKRSKKHDLCEASEIRNGYFPENDNTSENLEQSEKQPSKKKLKNSGTEIQETDELQMQAAEKEKEKKKKKSKKSKSGKSRGNEKCDNYVEAENIEALNSSDETDKRSEKPGKCMLNTPEVFRDASSDLSTPQSAVLPLGLRRDIPKSGSFDIPACRAFVGSNVEQVRGYFGSKIDWHYAKTKLEKRQLDEYKNQIERNYQSAFHEKF